MDRNRRSGRDYRPGQKPAAQGGVCPIQRPGGVAGGKMAVIQNPDLHLPVSCLVQQNIQIAPPSRSQKVRVWAGFQTHSSDVGIVDRGHVFPQLFFALPVKPEEGEYVRLQRAGQNGFQPVLHVRPSPKKRGSQTEFASSI